VQCDMWLDSCSRDSWLKKQNGLQDMFYLAISKLRNLQLNFGNKFINEIVVILQSLGVDRSSTIWGEIKVFSKGIQKGVTGKEIKNI